MDNGRQEGVRARTLWTSQFLRSQEEDPCVCLSALLRQREGRSHPPSVQGLRRGSMCDLHGVVVPRNETAARVEVNLKKTMNKRNRTWTAPTPPTLTSLFSHRTRPIHTRTHSSGPSSCVSLSPWSSSAAAAATAPPSSAPSPRPRQPLSACCPPRRPPTSLPRPTRPRPPPWTRIPALCSTMSIRMGVSVYKEPERGG